MKKTASSSRRWRWLLSLVLVAGIGAAAAWAYTQQNQPASTTAPALRTAKVRLGDITITASGGGTLTPAAQVSLAFRSGGILADVPVTVGDRVAAGQPVARLENADAQAQVAQAEINLRLAKLKLADLSNTDPAALAAARAGLATAQADLVRLKEPPTAAAVAAARENLTSAQEALADVLAGPTLEEVAIAKADVQIAAINVQTAQAAYDRVGQNPASSQAMALWQATTAYEKAEATYTQKLAAASDSQTAAARAKVATAESQLETLLAGPSAASLAAAEAKVAQSQAQLDAVSKGPTADDREVADLGVKLAQLNLANARRALDNTILKSPVAGVVTAVQGQPGEAVGSAPIVTMIDLSAPLVRFWLEESDLLSAAVGNPVTIVFDALPGYTFKGKITRVDPALASVSGTPAVQVWASVDLAAQPVALLSGLTAEVEVVAGSAKGALLVPVQALRETTPGSYYVFVVQEDDKLEMRPVTVGLKDFANAQILTGVQRGETVSTGSVETLETP